MRHRSSRLRLNQKPPHARLLERNLVTSLLLYEAIRTTRKRAKVVQPILDGLITRAKQGSPHVAIRSINAIVTDKNASRKLMEVLSKRYATRTSGFSTMKAVGSRKGDGAQLVDLTLIDAVVGKVTEEKPVKAKKAPKPAAEKKSSPSEASPQ